MRIRNYTPSDLDQCRNLWAEMTQRHRDIYADQSIGGEDPGLEFDAHLSRVGPKRVWVATHGGEAVGFVSLIVEGEEAEVEPIVVTAGQRDRGVGEELLRHAVQEARRLGVLVLSVKPVARNTEAISFFHEAGFTTLGHIQLFMWLGPSSPGQWKPGPTLFGRQFSY
jgi:ribosomal protein S18 acetylase RimI-like enzyme